MTTEFEELRGEDAKGYAEKYLQKTSVNYERWEVEYRDPETGQRYIMDYLYPEMQGGGIPRLRPAEAVRNGEKA